MVGIKKIFGLFFNQSVNPIQGVCWKAIGEKRFLFNYNCSRKTDIGKKEVFPNKPTYNFNA